MSLFFIVGLKEKSMTERVQKMKDSLRINKYPLCIQQFRLANESLDQTVGEPMLLRRAKLNAHVLDNIDIFRRTESRRK